MSWVGQEARKIARNDASGYARARLNEQRGYGYGNYSEPSLNASKISL